MSHAMMRRAGSVLGLLGLLWTVHVHAVDLGEVDADVEESMADSEAVSTQSKLAREREARERVETANEQRKAAQRSAAAEAKKRDATKELAQHEAEIAKLQTERAKHARDRKIADAKIAQQEKLLAASNAKLTKIRGELEALRTLRADQTKKIQELNQKAQDTAMNTVRLKSTFNDKRAEFERGKVELKAKQLEMQKAQKENAQTQASIQQQVQKLKTEYIALKAKNDAQAAQLAREKQSTEATRAQAKFAEGQVRQLRQPASGQPASGQPASKPVARPQPRAGSAPSTPK